MGLLATIFFGIIVGFIARLLKPGRDSMGFIATVLVGVAGAVLASYLGQSMGFYVVGEPAGFLASVLGAILILFIAEAAFGRKSRGIF